MKFCGLQSGSVNIVMLFLYQNMLEIFWTSDLQNAMEFTLIKLLTA